MSAKEVGILIGRQEDGPRLAIAQRVRQLLAGGIRKLRHPMRMRSVLAAMETAPG